jgi:hypothetical protein
LTILYWEWEEDDCHQIHENSYGLSPPPVVCPAQLARRQKRFCFKKKCVTFQRCNPPFVVFFYLAPDSSVTFSPRLSPFFILLKIVYLCQNSSTEDSGEFTSLVTTDSVSKF